MKIDYKGLFGIFHEHFEEEGRDDFLICKTKRTLKTQILAAMEDYASQKNKLLLDNEKKYYYIERAYDFISDRFKEVLTERDMLKTQLESIINPENKEDLAIKKAKDAYGDSFEYEIKKGNSLYVCKLKENQKICCSGLPNRYILMTKK